jgi:hypothetical protein
MLHHARRAALAAMIVFAATPAVADISKDQCIDAHSKGQDARTQGKLTLARKLFLTCAASACPSLVQGDCARFADDLGKVQPSLTFAARDANGADLPDTTVYVDDALVATRLDGSPYEIDPGKHEIRFQRGKDEQTLTIVVNTGEKGRAVVANFAGPAPVAPVITPPTPAIQEPAIPPPPPPGAKKPFVPKLLIGAGTAIFVGGTVVAVLGYTGLPEGCELSTNECNAAPGDPVFEEAGDKVRLGNIGLITGGVGLAMLVAGVVWYATADATTESAVQLSGVSPWISPDGAGFAVSGRL